MSEVTILVKLKTLTESVVLHDGETLNITDINNGLVAEITIQDINQSTNTYNKDKVTLIREFNFSE